MAITEPIPAGLLMPMVDYEATKAVIEAKTIERCRLATVARLREIEIELETKMKPIRRVISRYSISQEWIGLVSQKGMVLRLIDYFRRPARYEAMVRRTKDA